MLEVKKLSYKYNDQEILKDINYTFEKNKIYSIIGKSGVGKSTFLSLISGLEFSQQGELFYNQKKVTHYASYRRNISYIFQSFNLVSYLSTVENLKLAIAIHNKTSNIESVETILGQLGIRGENLTKRCSELSGGQQQRVAIARAVALDTELIIADEPTGNLDRDNAKQVMRLFQRLKESGKCVVIVTHDTSLEKHSDVVLTLEKGQLLTIN
jgi:putative ABC transport system ATP-binding protein